MRDKRSREIWQEELAENHFFGTVNSRHMDNLEDLLEYVTELETMVEEGQDIVSYYVGTPQDEVFGMSTKNNEDWLTGD